METDSNEMNEIYENANGKRERKCPYFFLNWAPGNNRTVRERKIFSPTFAGSCLFFSFRQHTLGRRKLVDHPPKKKNLFFLFFFLSTPIVDIIIFHSAPLFFFSFLFISHHNFSKWRNRCDGYDFYERKSKSNYFTFFFLVLNVTPFF